MQKIDSNNQSAGGFRSLCLGEESADRCLIIGEVAQTHDGSLGQAHAFIDAIANCGADAVKFQTHIAEAESTPQEPWRVKFSRQDATRYEYWQRMEFAPGQWAGLKEHAEDRGLLFLSTPFSPEAAEMLAGIGMKVWKIASGEVANIPLMKRVLADPKPVILSSGMSGWNELDEAVALIRQSLAPFAVLQCTSAYPCPPEKIGLNLLDEFRRRYECPVGLSDHSGNIFAGLAAATLGAEVLEVHVTLSREMFGPDVPASVTTAEFRQLVQGVREIGRMTASPVSKEDAAKEMAPLRNIFTKSIYAAGPLPAGTRISEENVRLKKPGTGVPAAQLPNLLGATLKRDIRKDEPVLLEDIEIAKPASGGDR